MQDGRIPLPSPRLVAGALTAIILVPIGAYWFTLHLRIDTEGVLTSQEAEGVRLFDLNGEGNISS